MATRAVENTIRGISERLLSEELDTLSTYLMLRDLNSFLNHHPFCQCSKTVDALNKCLDATYLAARRLQYFTYREASRAMAHLIVNARDPSLSVILLHKLKSMVNESNGSQRRGIAEVLGSLPVRIEGPEIKEDHSTAISTLKWEALLTEHQPGHASGWETAGRSLVSPLDENQVVVIKLATDSTSIQWMETEIQWMLFLGSHPDMFTKRFDVPEPLKTQGDYLFYLEDLPGGLCEQIDLSGPKALGFIYKAHRDYFVYPNDHRKGRQLAPDEFCETMFRNAWLLGKLTSAGIIHAAPIPLFHNRVQRNRRPDSGLYEWHKGGRLDRWLHSCQYPNFGLSGIRDFEHLESCQKSGWALYKKIGTHILSLILVSGSYFRNMEVDRFGRDNAADPVDARDLFDQDLLTELTQGVYANYFEGFSGLAFPDDMPSDFTDLIPRMIREMGVDSHMEEMVRIADQKAMTDRGFEVFLKTNQLSTKHIFPLQKGQEDLAIMTGPHLGEFGGEISLPELIEFLEVSASMCVLGKYLKENGLDSVDEMRNNIFG